MDTINRIIVLLKEQNKTQKELTDYLGLDKSTFSQWKKGTNTSYTKYYKEIADFFNVPINNIIGDKYSDIFDKAWDMLHNKETNPTSKWESMSIEERQAHLISLIGNDVSPNIKYLLGMSLISSEMEQKNKKSDSQSKKADCSIPSPSDTDDTINDTEKTKSPREFATREDAIKYYQQDLTEEEFKELEMFADFLRYRRGHQP